MAPGDASSPDRARLLTELTTLRERERRLKRRARSIELGAAWAVGLLVVVGYQVLVRRGAGMAFFGASNWLFALVAGLFGFVATRGTVAAIATRWLLPARRDVAQASSRLHAHDVAAGRHRPLG